MFGTFCGPVNIPGGLPVVHLDPIENPCFILNQWFLTRGAPPQGSASLYALYNMESLINKFANKHMFIQFIKCQGFENKRRLLKVGVV